MVVRERVHIAECARVTYAVLVHMYICSRVPTRCSALGRTARQNSARPYYLRFVSWLQTITHFPGSSHLSPFSAGFIPPAQSPSVSFSRAHPLSLLLFHSLTRRHPPPTSSFARPPFLLGAALSLSLSHLLFSFRVWPCAHYAAE